VRQWAPSLGQFESRPIVPGTLTHLQDDGAGNLTPTSASYLEGTGEISLFSDYYLVDETTGEATPANVFGSPSFGRTSYLTTPWFNQGEPSTAFFVTFPEARHGHVFTLLAEGVSYSLTTGPLLSYAAADGSLASYGFFEGWGSTGPGGPYFVVDHTTSEQSNTRPAADRNFVSDTTWSGFTGTLPTRLLTLWLPESEASNWFTLHTGAGSLIWLYPAYGTGVDSAGTPHTGYFVSAAIGVNQSFTLVRDLDGASAAGAIGIQDLSADFTGAFTPYQPPPPEPPYEPDWQVVTVQVGENHWDHTIMLQAADGSLVYPTADWANQGFQAAYDNGIEYYRYNYVPYTATIDAKLSYTAIDSAGHTSFMDGFNPPALPTPTVLTIQVGENHWDHPVLVHLTTGAPVLATPDWTTQGSQTASANGEVYYSYNWVNYVATIPVGPMVSSISDDQGHTELMDGFNPPPPPPELQPLYLNIAASRWQHTLEVHTSSGGVFPVVADRMQGFWTVDQTSQSWWTSYYYFNARSSSHVGENWWVYDATTGDTAGVISNELSDWASPDAGADADQDGLVNWYEALLGTDPNSTDTDGDGLSDPQELAHHTNPLVADSDSDGLNDGWEVTHNLNPLLDDSQADPDDDGLINLEEAQYGSNPAVADSDSDGATDAQEVAEGTDPSTFGRILSVELVIDAARAAHAFSLELEGVDQGLLTQGLKERADGTYTSSTVSLDLARIAQYTLVDASCGEHVTLRAVDAGEPFYNVTAYQFRPAGPWLDASGVATDRLSFLLPPSREGRVLVAYAGDAFFPVTSHTFTAELYESSFNSTSPAAYLEGRSLGNFGDADFVLIDVTANQSSPMGETDLSHVEWVENTVPLPFRSVTIWVGSASVYTVSAGGASQSVESQTIEAGGESVYAVTALVPIYGSFTIERTSDAVSSSGTIEFDDATFDWRAAFFVPPPPPWTTITFRVGQNYWGNNFYAAPSAQYAIVDPSGGWEEPSLENAYVHGSFPRINDNGEQEPYYYTRYLLTYETALATAIVSTGGRISPLDPETEVYLDGRLSTPKPLMLNIAASRWSHQLEVRTVDGDVFPITKGRTQGFWSPFGAAGRTNFVPYWFFDAESSFRPGSDWWIYDVTTGESAAVGLNLTQWNVGQAEMALDTDGDSLPDWYERIIGSNLNDSDTDDDGLTDGAEVQAGRDPCSADAPPVRILLSAGRAAHGFHMEVSAGVAPSVNVVGLVESSPVFGNAFAVDVYIRQNGTTQLVDSTTNEKLNVTAYRQATSVDARPLRWDSNSPRQYFLIDAARRSHPLLLAQPDGSFYPVSVLSTPISARMAGDVPLPIRYEAWAAYHPGQSFRIADLSTRTASAVGETDLALTDWTNLDAAPAVAVDLILDATELNNRFTLWTQAPGGVPMAQILTARPWEGEAARQDSSGNEFTIPQAATFVSGALPIGSSCWLVRQGGGSSDPAIHFQHTFTGSWKLDSALWNLQGHFPPLPPNLTKVDFLIPAEWTPPYQVAYLDSPEDPSVPMTTAVTITGLQVVQAYDAHWQWVGEFTYCSATASVDESREWQFTCPDLLEPVPRKTNFCDSIISATIPAGPHTFVANIFAGRQAHALALHQPLGAGKTVTPLVLTSTLTASPVKGDHFTWDELQGGVTPHTLHVIDAAGKLLYVNRYFSVTVGYDSSRPFWIEDGTVGDPAPMNQVDLKSWSPPVTLKPLLIPTTRFGHDLWVCRENGSSALLQQFGTQGTISTDADHLGWFETYHVFNARAGVIKGFDWWIEDRTSGDKSPRASQFPMQIGAGGVRPDLESYLRTWVNPLQPQNLQATAGPRSVDLSWDAPDPALPGSTVIVERRRPGQVRWSRIGQPAGTATSYHDGGLFTQTQYSYQIRFSDENGRQSAPSSAVDVSTLADPSSVGADPATPPDSDGDGISDETETAAGTDPFSFDTDEDGVSDSDEAAAGTDPTADDTDDDGVPDFLDQVPRDSTRAGDLPKIHYVAVPLTSIIPTQRTIAGASFNGPDRLAFYEDSTGTSTGKSGEYNLRTGEIVHWPSVPEKMPLAGGDFAWLVGADGGGDHLRIGTYQVRRETSVWVPEEQEYRSVTESKAYAYWAVSLYGTFNESPPEPPSGVWEPDFQLPAFERPPVGMTETWLKYGWHMGQDGEPPPFDVFVGGSSYMANVFEPWFPSGSLVFGSGNQAGDGVSLLPILPVPTANWLCGNLVKGHATLLTALPFCIFGGGAKRTIVPEGYKTLAGAAYSPNQPGYMTTLGDVFFRGFGRASAEQGYFTTKLLLHIAEHYGKKKVPHLYEVVLPTTSTPHVMQGHVNKSHLMLGTDTRYPGTVLLIPVHVVTPRKPAAPGTNALNIATWEKAYAPYSSAGGAVKPEFIDSDPDRFYIRVPKISGLTDNLDVKISTVSPEPEYSDNDTTVKMIEDGPWLSSKAQILVSDAGDDIYHEQGAGTDNTLDDCTHLAQLGSTVKVRVTTMGHTDEITLSVPDMPIKQVSFVAFVFRNKPAAEWGEAFVTSDWVKQDVRHINERYAQAGIRFVLKELRHVDPPTLKDLMNGVQMRVHFREGVTYENEKPIYGVGEDFPGIVKVFYVNFFNPRFLRNPDDTGLNGGILGYTGVNSEYSLVSTSGRGYDTPNTSKYTYLTAHELAHALGLEDVPDYVEPIPSWVMLNKLHGGRNQVITSKRFTQDQITKMRTSKWLH
jgi:hypothetical protein